MSGPVALYALELLGAFRLFAPDGTRIGVSSKRGRALIAMLAMAGSGERTRSWLQDRLWGSRAPNQAQASLRRELSNLRKLLSHGPGDLLQSDHDRVWLDLARLRVDARDMAKNRSRGDFLEGLDLPGEEGFEDWLREERAQAGVKREISADPRLNPALDEAMRQPSAIAQPFFASRPALAVLAFVNATPDADLDLVAEGLSEDLIDRLSRLRWLPIIARSSSFAFRGRTAEPKAVGEALGARYLLEGRLRAGLTGLTLAISLADTETGQILWSNSRTFTRGSDPLALEDLLTGLTTALGTRIDSEEQTRALRKPQSDLNVQELIWRGRWHLNRFTAQDSALARDCFARALEAEPNSPEAIIQSTWARVWDLWAQRGSDDEIRAARQMAQQAIIADCDDARGHMLAGIAEIWLQQPLRAEALLRRAIELNPSLVMAHAQLGSALHLRGDHGQAIAVLNIAIRLSPNDHDLFFILGELAMAHLLSNQLDEALTHADHAISRRSAYWVAHVAKVNALARMSRKEEAQQALDELHASKNRFSPDFVDWLPFTDPRKNIFLKDGLNLVAA